MLLRKLFPAFLITLMLGFLFVPVLLPQAADQVQVQVQAQGEDPVAIDPSLIFTTIAALSAAVLAFTALAKKWLNTNSTLTIVVSGIISFAVSGIGYWVQAGIFSAVEWWYIFVYGAAAMLIANGFSTWEIIKTILTFFKLKLPAEKT